MDMNVPCPPPAHTTVVTTVMTVVILGVPRSGTTWLAKIFDSHPDVLYRHEPDTVMRQGGLPRFIARGEAHLFRGAARDRLRRLTEVRVLKSAGSLPMFRKSFSSTAGHLMRWLMVHGLRLADLLPSASRAARRLAIPDLIHPCRPPPSHLVMKSVGACGRAGLVADAMPEGRVILILRNPCGQVASMMRGYELGKFDSPLAIADLLATEQAARHGLSAARLHGMPALERFAWHWALLNEKAAEDLRDAPNARILRYEDLAADPAGTVRGLFAFAGLDWHPQTERFLRRSTRHRWPGSLLPTRYYQVVRDTAAVVDRWRDELPRDDIRRIAAIVRRTSIWRFYPELAPYLDSPLTVAAAA